MNEWKDHFQYLISFDLLSAKERLPNALNDACRLLFKKKTIIQSEMRTVHETSVFSLLLLFLFTFITLSSLNVSHWFDTFTPRALYHTKSTLCLCILEIYVWKVTLLSLYLLLDYFYYLAVKRRPTKIQILEVDG